MNPKTQPRLRVPMVMAAGGTMIALATLLGRGPSRAALVEAFTIVATIGYHWLGGRDTDGGSLFGSRADERQEDIGSTFQQPLFEPAGRIRQPACFAHRNQECLLAGRQLRYQGVIRRPKRHRVDLHWILPQGVDAPVGS